MPATLAEPRGGSPAALAALRFTTARTALGPALVVASETGLAALLLGDDLEALVADLRRRFPKAAVSRDDAGLEALARQAAAAVDRPGEGEAGGIPLDLRGTPFQRRVWQALQELPAGRTVSYAELAARLGSPTATRAVAGACGANPVAVLVPCHRVVRQDGGLSGYRWGLDRKRALLAREGALPA